MITLTVLAVVGFGSVVLASLLLAARPDPLPPPRSEMPKGTQGVCAIKG